MGSTFLFALRYFDVNNFRTKVPIKTSIDDDIFEVFKGNFFYSKRSSLISANDEERSVNFNCKDGAFCKVIFERGIYLFKHEEGKGYEKRASIVQGGYSDYSQFHETAAKLISLGFEREDSLERGNFEKRNLKTRIESLDIKVRW